ncbi:MAG: hypothetical protein K9G76_09860 [Bacteroidales bacterium]|nr:hypothetical protein [Bacteroidales bacterium]MCF8404004.1 hypothetical protein [Bacteroidales bacterium]
MNKTGEIILIFLLNLLLLGFNSHDSLSLHSLNNIEFDALADDEKLDILIKLSDSLLAREPELCIKYAHNALNLSEKLEGKGSIDQFGWKDFISKG